MIQHFSVGMKTNISEAPISCHGVLLSNVDTRGINRAAEK
jgi:hypothetical protein